MLWTSLILVYFYTLVTAYDTDFGFARSKAEQLEHDRLTLMNETTTLLRGLLKNYDKTLRPGLGNKPIQVNVTVLVDSLGPISETENSFRVDFNFRQFWVDKRLSFKRPKHLSGGALTLSHDFIKKIWVPDSYFPDSLNEFKHSTMVPNMLLRLTYTGEILLSCRVTVIAKCTIDLTYFPMDEQQCRLIIETYGYTTNDLILQWKSEGAVKVTNNINLAQFELRKHKIDQYELNFTTGNFTDLEITFYLKRILVYHIIQSYVPSTLLVVLSWVGFWVDRKSTPARASLSITSVLTLMMLMGGVNSRLPKASKVKALDYYFILSFVFVFAALIEFSVITYIFLLKKVGIKKRGRSGIGYYAMAVLVVFDRLIVRINPAKVDSYSKRIFPSSYITVIFIYCGRYAYISSSYE